MPVIHKWLKTTCKVLAVIFISVSLVLSITVVQCIEGESYSGFIYSYFVLFFIIILLILMISSLNSLEHKKELENYVSIEEYEHDIEETIKEVKETTSKEVAELAYKNFIKEYSFSISDIITLYPVVLLLKKYRITVYYIVNDPLEVHVTVPMSVYTKMSINKDVTDIIKYHIEGTDTTL